METCVALPHLRELEFWGMSRVTPACLPALQAMSGLTHLTLRDSTIHRDDVAAEVRAAFDVESIRRGWPRLKIELGRAR
jgi:hypothetical protein